MKQLNRNIYLLVIGIAEVLFFAYIFVIYQRGLMDTKEFGGCCIYMALMAALALAVAFRKNTWLGKKNKGGFNPALIEVPHTREGITVEVLTGLIIVGAWVVAIASNRFWIIEGFYSFLNPLLMFMLTIISITFLWIVYLPAFKTQRRRHTNMEQVVLDVSMCRWLAVEFALIVLTFALPLEDYSIVLLYIIGAALVVTVLIYQYLIYNARSNPEDIEHNEAFDGFDIDEATVPRTAMGTAIEVISGILAISAWVISAINGLFTENDGSFSLSVFFNLLTFTCFVIIFLKDAYRPRNIQGVGNLTNLKQVKLAIGMYRLCALVTAVTILLSSFPRVDLLWLYLGMAAILTILVITFRILIHRAKE